MKQYDLSVCYPSYAILHVEADSEQEAIEKARRIDASGDVPMNFETMFEAEPTFMIEGVSGNE